MSSGLLDSVIFIVDSSQAISGAAGSFSYIMNVPKGRNYDRVCVLQAILPKSYYMVTAPLNIMTLTEPGMPSVTVSMTPGNYNAISWKTLAAAALNAASPHGWTYSISFPNSSSQVDTGVFTYTVSGNGGSQPTFTFGNANQTTIYEQWGFLVNSTNTFVGNSLTSTAVVKFQQEDTILIHSNISYNNDQSAFTDVLQEIYASSSLTFSNIIYQNSGAVDAYSKVFNNRDNNVYTFTCTDEHNNIINFNGLNVVFTILIYRRDDISAVQKRFIEYQVQRQR